MTSVHQVIDLTSEESGIDAWRKEINPFQIYAFLNDSKFSFESNKHDYSSRKGEQILDLGDQKYEKEIKENEEQSNPIQSNSDQSYHLEFLTFIIANIKSLKCFDTLFDLSEKRILESFMILSEDCQDLYIRLFQRKRTWHKEGKIQYNGIDCPSCISCLSKEGLYICFFKNAVIRISRFTIY
jgi:hypothetical protein